jgi:hypothetical protein
LAVLALLGGLVIFGLVAQGRSLSHLLGTLGFVAYFLLVARLWGLTLRNAKTAPPVTRK